MFIIFDNDGGEFLSNNSHEEWGEFFFDGDQEVKTNSSGFVVETKGYFFGEFNPAKASFETKEDALKFAEKIAESFLKDGWAVNLEISSVEVEEEIVKRGGKVIESRQYATVRCVDSIHREPFEDDETTEMEKILGELIPENFHPHSYNNAEYVAARKIINELREMGYEITKRRKNDD